MEARKSSKSCKFPFASKVAVIACVAGFVVASAAAIVFALLWNQEKKNKTMIPAQKPASIEAQKENANFSGIEIGQSLVAINETSSIYDFYNWQNFAIIIRAKLAPNGILFSNRDPTREHGFSIGTKDGCLFLIWNDQKIQGEIKIDTMPHVVSLMFDGNTARLRLDGEDHIVASVSVLEKSDVPLLLGAKLSIEGKVDGIFKLSVDDIMECYIHSIRILRMGATYSNFILDPFSVRAKNMSSHDDQFLLKKPQEIRFAVVPPIKQDE